MSAKYRVQFVDEGSRVLWEVDDAPLPSPGDNLVFPSRLRAEVVAEPRTFYLEESTSHDVSTIVVRVEARA